MKKTILFLSFISLSYCLAAQPSDSAWIMNNYTKEERQITMRDGIKLFTSIYIPKDTTETHPILFKRTPYSCAPYGKNKWGDVWNSYQKEYFKERYIMVTQDVRGRWMSEGEFVDVRPFNPNKKTSKDIDEASDTYDSIDWLIKNVSNNNGKVGVFGISYPGFYSTMAAASSHPALVAVSPQAPVTNWFIGDDWHHNGAFFLMDAFNFYSALGGGFGQPHPKPDSLPGRNVGYPVHDNYKFYNDPANNVNRVLSINEPGAILPKSDLVRIAHYKAAWEVKTLDKNKIAITYFLSIDPGGSLPAGIVNLFITAGPYETFRKLGEMLKN